MDLGACQSIIIFGGSFDPPHNGHVALPTLVMQKLGADSVAYIPAALQPLKQDIEQTPAAHRLAMLRLAVAELPHAIVLTDEIDRAGDGAASYTVDTLEALRSRLGDDVVMRLLIGVDQLRLFDRWRQPQRIVALAEPIVMLRPPQAVDSLGELLPAGYDVDEWAARVVDVPQMDVSSTQVRRRAQDGESISEFVPAAVARYIEDHGLYQA